MDTAKIHTFPFIVVASAVVIIEVAARRLHADIDPLVVTGAARIIDIASILAVFYLFHQGRAALGLSPRRIKTGIKRGIIWSAVFGIISGLIGTGLHFAGIDPLGLIQVHMPDDIRRLVLLYIIGCAVGPVAEEMFFRGVVYGYIRCHLGVCVALAVTTLVFVAAHQPGPGIPLPQLVGGVVFCLSYEYEKSLMTPIIIHSLGNTALFTLSLVAR